MGSSSSGGGLPAEPHLHNPRGWGATTAARDGAPTKGLMHRLGHASPAAALRYPRAEQEGDAALAAAMGETLRHMEGTDST